MPLTLLPDADVGAILAPLDFPQAHPATFDEIEESFVTGSPFEAKRARLLNALRLYVSVFDALIPGSRYLVDGGFLTRKDWEPDDIDVLVITPAGASDALDEQQRVEFAKLRTRVLDAVSRVCDKPMSGLVDAVVVDLSHDFVLRYSFDVFTAVRDRGHNVIQGRPKGLVEVIQGG